MIRSKRKHIRTDSLIHAADPILYLILGYACIKPAAFERFEQAMIDKDIDTLNDLVTADKTFTHMSGKVQTKEQFFGEIEDGTLNYYSYKLNSPVVTVD